MDCKEKYKHWLENANDEIKEELRGYSEKEIEDSFYKELAFGTGGLRGVIGAGTNKLNIYTVGKATQGLADYLLKTYGEKACVVIGFDSRIKVMCLPGRRQKYLRLMALRFTYIHAFCLFLPFLWLSVIWGLVAG